MDGISYKAVQAGGNSRVIFDDQDVGVDTFEHIRILPDI
jgi:hypothetical protein